MDSIKNSTYRILKRLYRKRKKQIPIDTFSELQKNIVSELVNKRYAEWIEGDLIKAPQGMACLISEKTAVKITAAGEAYVETTRRLDIRYWVPIIISNLISITALIVSLLK